MIELVDPCQECGKTDTLDPSMRICFDCWCILDLKESEQNAVLEEE